MGQILHGTIGVVKQVFGVAWPEKVAVLDPSVLEHVSLLPMQNFPRLMAVILHPGYCILLYAIVAFKFSLNFIRFS